MATQIINVSKLIRVFYIIICEIILTNLIKIKGISEFLVKMFFL